MLLEDVSFDRAALSIAVGVPLSKVTVCAKYGLLPNKRRGVGHPIPYSLADMLDLDAAFLLYRDGAVSFSAGRVR